MRTTPQVSRLVTRHVSHTPAACSFPGENARSWDQRLCKELGVPSSRKPSLTASGSFALILFTLGCSSLVTDLSPSLPCEVKPVTAVSPALSSISLSTQQVLR